LYQKIKIAIGEVWWTLIRKLVHIIYTSNTIIVSGKGNYLMWYFRISTYNSRTAKILLTSLIDLFEYMTLKYWKYNDNFELNLVHPLLYKKLA